MKFAHTCLWIEDLDRTKAFYEDTLDFVPSREFTGSEYQPDVYNYFVTDGTGVELQFKQPLEGADVTAELGTGPKATGMDHIAVEVDDVDARIDSIARETDHPVVVEPTSLESTNSRFAFVEDPDGYLVELVQYGD
jgi:lactoylglutathione lyase